MSRGRPAGCSQATEPKRLAEHCGELGLLLAGSRRYGPMRAVLLGGVSGRLIEHAACPVIVMAHGVELPLATLFATATAAGSEP